MTSPTGRGWDVAHRPKCSKQAKVKDADGNIQRDDDGKPLTKPCGQPAIKGTEPPTCRMHGASAPQVRAKAIIRAELTRWNINDPTVSPAQQMLALLTQSSVRANTLTDALNEQIDKHGGDLAAALVGDSLMLDRDGREVKVGEYVRGLVKLENEERDRCMNFAKIAHMAKLGERAIEIAEKQAEIIIKAVEAALDAAGVAAGARGPAKIAAARVLKAVE